MYRAISNWTRQDATLWQMSFRKTFLWCLLSDSVKTKAKGEWVKYWWRKIKNNLKREYQNGKSTHHQNTSCCGISVCSAHPSVVGIVRDLVAPQLRHVKPLCVPDVSFQPDVLTLATSVRRQQIPWPSPMTTRSPFPRLCANTNLHAFPQLITKYT